jgi:hypothetical protein
MRSIGFPQISACLYVEMEMVGRTKREMTKSMELEVELVHRQLTNSKRSVKNGMSSLFTPNVFSKYWNQLKSHEITIQIYTVSFQNLGHDASFRRISSLWIWSGHWGGLRPRGSAEQGSMCCHRRNLALNPRWKSLKHRKRMEENGREVKMVKTQANCIKLYKIVSNCPRSLSCSTCLLCLVGQENLSCFSLLQQAALPASHPKCTCEMSQRFQGTTVINCWLCRLLQAALKTASSADVRYSMFSLVSRSSWRIRWKPGNYFQGQRSIGELEDWILKLGSRIVKRWGGFVKLGLKIIENGLWNLKPGFWNFGNCHHVNLVDTDGHFESWVGDLIPWYSFGHW